MVAGSKHKETGEFKRGWPIILTAALGIGCGLSAMPFFTFGLFIGPIEAEFGWSRGEIQRVLFFFTLTSMFTLPVMGLILDRFGPRRVAIASQIIFALAFSSLALVPNNLFIFYGMWVGCAFLSIGSTAITYSYVINSWFDKRRGIALGLTLSGTGFAAALAPSYANWLIETFGWRAGYPGMAAVTLFVSVPLLVLVLRNRPTDQKQAAESDSTSTPPVPSDSPGMTLREAATSRRFWIIGIGMFGVSVGTGGVVPSLVPLLGDSGYTAEDAALYAGLIGLMVITGRVLVGVLLDYFWAPLVAVIFFVPSALACVMLTQNDISPVVIVISVMLIGLVAGAEFDIIAYFVSRYFGMKNYGAIYSWVCVVFISGTAIAPALYGAAYDMYGSYDVALIGTGLLIVITALPLLLLGKGPAEYRHSDAKA